MTVLNIYFELERIFLVADTQASDPKDKTPIGFGTKIFVAPHWEMLICGTGSAQFLIDWYCKAMNDALARDIRGVDQFAADALNALFPKHQARLGADFTSTIYHFGLGREDRRFAGFGYRSRNRFNSEELAPGTFVKPSYEDPSRYTITTLPDDFVELAKRQKAADAALPLSDQVTVGGHLIAYLMDINGSAARTTVWRCHEFPDFDSGFATAQSRLNACNEAQRKS